MRSILLSLVLTASAFAQPVSVGVRAGMPLTDFISTVQTQPVAGALGIVPGFQSNTRPYVFGPTVELRLPAGLGIELDALYRRLNYTGAVAIRAGDFSGVIATTVLGGEFSSTSANAWEFPLLLKYRFKVPVVKPYVDAGFAWDTLAGLTQSIRQTVGAVTNTSTTSTPAALHRKGTSGFVMGAGLDIHAVLVHLSPEVRYTHWGSPHFEDPVSLVKSNQSQAEFLLGITF